MSKNVFANGKEISAKKDDNKSTAGMPAQIMMRATRAGVQTGDITVEIE